MKNLILLFTLILLSCDSTQNPTRHTIKLSNTGATRPIATYYLFKMNIEMSSYEDINNNGIYTTEGQIIPYKGNPLNYKVYGTKNGKWDKIELTLKIHNHDTNYESKYELRKAFIIICKRIIGKNYEDEKYKVLRTITSELFKFMHVPSTNIYTGLLFGKINLEEYNPDRMIFLEHILYEETIIFDNKASVRIKRTALQSPHKWKDPYQIQITFTKSISL